MCEEYAGFAGKSCEKLRQMQDLDMQVFSGIITIISPHMDDEALACGGLIAQLPNKNRIHIIYATDGMKSPAPIFPGQGEISPDLGEIRIRESTKAMRLLGVPEENLHFLGLPDALLQENKSALQKSLRKKFKQINPQHIFLPFRYDRSSDHLAVNHVVVSDIQQGLLQAQLIEFFVYYRYRLLPKRDIRRYIRPSFLYALDISEVAKQKRQALDSYTSQTTKYYSWQTRPILTATLLDEECQNPEYFLMTNGMHSGTTVFTSSVILIRLAHRLEPILVRWKYLINSLLKRLNSRNV